MYANTSKGKETRMRRWLVKLSGVVKAMTKNSDRVYKYDKLPYFEFMIKNSKLTIYMVFSRILCNSRGTSSNPRTLVEKQWSLGSHCFLNKDCKNTLHKP